MRMRVEPADAGDVEALADAWVALAAEQRVHGSHLYADRNRERIRESMAHHVVEGTCLVARPVDGDDPFDDAGEDETDGEGTQTDDEETDGEPTEPGNGDDWGFLGFVTFSMTDGGYEMDATRGEVENLFVRPSARGGGVGAALLSATEAALADRDVDVVSLEVLAGNARAREFYEREGYGEHRVVVEKRVDVETDTKANRGR
jgi:ribosomal protein S18 acetylase RimI-like enzyme